MSSKLENVIDDAMKLLINERMELARFLLEESSSEIENEARKQSALTIVEETYGSIKGLDHEILVRLAEDEEFCGY